MTYIDLSVTVDENTPVYPGDPEVSIAPAGVFAKDGFNDHIVTIGTHVGTHIDAPLHMIENGKSLDDFSIEYFIGHGVYIDAQNGFNLKEIQAVNIQAGDIVILHTGMSAHYLNASYFEKFIPIPEDVATYIASCDVKMIGMDMGSPDHEPFNVHKIFLKNDILIIENLTNLDQLASKSFKIFAFPTKLSVDGAPARVVAEIS